MAARCPGWRYCADHKRDPDLADALYHSSIPKNQQVRKFRYKDGNRTKVLGVEAAVNDHGKGIFGGQPSKAELLEALGLDYRDPAWLSY